MRSINPGVKLATLIVASLMLSLTYNVAVNVAVCLACLVATVATSGVNRRRLALALLPFFLTALAFFTTGLFFGAGGAGNAEAVGVSTSVFGQRTLLATDWTTAMQLASRVLAYGGLGMLFAFTSNAFELVMSLMQQFRLPPKFAYGILAAYHFFPVVREEFGTVGAALKVRGVKAGPFSTRRLLPMLAQIEDSPQVDGLLILLNNGGGDVEAGLAIAELIAGMTKPTVSIVLGGSHSIGVPLAVAARRSFAVPSAAMTIHPVRMSGTVIAAPQTYNYFQRLQDRIVAFVSSHSQITAQKFQALMLKKDDMAADVGSVVYGEEAVSLGIIDQVGGLSDGLQCLYRQIEEARGKRRPS